MHTALSGRCPIAASPGRSLSQHVSLPLLACHARQPHGRLAQVAQEHGGLGIALDGLAPQGGEPHIGCMRARSTGLTRRRGWLAQLAPPTFAACLAPLRPLEWPMRAGLRDKHTGCGPAVATALPGSRHPLCQAHSRRHRAEPLAAAETVFKGARRQAVRQQVGALLRQDSPRAPGHAGLLTVPGLLPSPVAEPPAPPGHCPAPAVAPMTAAPAAAQVRTQRVRHTRYWRTRKGRSPWRLAGIAT